MKKQTFATVAAPTAAGNEPSMLISTIALDRDRDVVVPEGGEFASYLQNPVVGLQHFRDEALPVGVTTSLQVEPGRGIRATWRWLKGDPVADRVRNAYEQGVLRAASIGFLASASEPMPGGGRRFTKWELAEWSLVAVPSNREAVRTLRGLGLWDDDEPVLELLDDDDVLEISEDFARELAARTPHRLNSAALAGLVDEPKYDIGVRELDALVAQATRDAVREHLRDAVGRALRLARGRLD